MPNVSTDEKKQEALERMRAIGIFEGTIKQFEQDGLISRSDPPGGFIYWLNETELERVREFEKSYDGLVYHVIHTYSSNMGELYDYLYVSDHKDEWPMDREDIENDQLFVYCDNLTMPDCSELGTIGYQLTPAAGLVRTW